MEWSLWDMPIVWEVFCIFSYSALQIKIYSKSPDIFLLFQFFSCFLDLEKASCC